MSDMKIRIEATETDFEDALLKYAIESYVEMEEERLLKELDEMNKEEYVDV